MPGEFKMINGEKTCEPSPEVVPPDPLDRVLPSLQSQNSDNGEESPVYSQYSSCGDSEFERYCSANSVMGTPSLCSSVGTFQEYSDLDFGSLRSSTFGDSGSLENFRLESEFTRNVGESSITSSSGSGCLSGHRNEDFEGKNGFEVRNDVVGQVAVGINDGFDSYRNMEHSSCNEFSNGNIRTVSPKLSTITDEEPCVEADCGGIVRLGDRDDLAMMHAMHSTKGVELESHLQTGAQQVESCLDELHTHSDVEFEKGGRCLNENDNSPRFEHSEGEDSMFGCGTDDDQKLELLPPKSMQDHHEAKAEKGKSLLMSSCIAFGSDDWEDFEHETKQYDMTSFMSEKRHLNTEHEEIVTSSLSQTTAFPVLNPKQGEVEMDISLSSNQLQGAGELFYRYSSLTPVDILDCGETKLGKDTKYMVGAKNGNGELDESADYLKNQTKSDILPRDQILLSQKLPSKKVLNFMGDNFGESRGLLSSQEFGNIDGNRVSECQELGQSTIQLDPLFDFTSSQFYSAPTEAVEAQTVDVLGEASKSLALDKNFVKKPMKDFPASFDLFEARPKAIKTENVELFDFCNEVVHEMEEILLDSAESSGAMFTQCDMPSQAHSPLPLRDGGSTASTSGTDDAFSLNQQSQRIDGIEVIGAKQKKGDVSFSERLVGVKEYTVYVMRVWSGKDNWEVERRYRDFCTLHRRLKSLFSSQGWILPSPWSSVERESRKFFGNVSPDVVAERSALIQECLQSILHYQFPTSLPIALIWFLSPQKILPSSPSSNTPRSQSPVSGRGTDTYRVLTFGKTISLIVEIRPHKSTKQILEGQHYTCAGCHKHFDDGKTKVLEFVQTLGWGKPRLCEYTGQLFCSSCHTNETAVLPARVLHHWDFTLYPVSQLAKSYLDSIHDKPMLCVSAVNPFLFSKVPALQQVTGVRKRIGVMLPYVRCPFRMSIYKGLASRRYLLESNDFFALRDLIDLSKGAFAALPVMVDTVSRRILKHITEQCLVCCDVGIPCNARQACNDPSALIFPFQEAEIERCRSCKSVFHKLCFRKITICPCGVSLDPDREKGGSANASNRVSSELSSTLNLFGRKSNSKSSMGFLSGLFTKGKQEKLWGPKDGDTVISMGSLPSTSL